MILKNSTYKHRRHRARSTIRKSFSKISTRPHKVIPLRKLKNTSRAFIGYLSEKGYSNFTSMVNSFRTSRRRCSSPPTTRLRKQHLRRGKKRLNLSSVTRCEPKDLRQYEKQPALLALASRFYVEIV